jgi:hypothetical protein
LIGKGGVEFRPPKLELGAARPIGKLVTPSETGIRAKMSRGTHPLVEIYMSWEMT